MIDDDPHLERLMTRRLDGELTPEEELELEDLLRTRPDGRRLLEEYARNDRLAGLALRGSFSAAGPHQPTTHRTPAHHGPVAGRCGPIPERPIGRRRDWLSYSLVAAMAACIAMVMMFRDQWSPSTPANHSSAVRPVRVDDRWLQNASHPRTPRPLWTTPIEYPHRRSRHTGRNVLGIKDPKADRYYILEYNTRTVRTVPVRGSI